MQIFLDTEFTNFIDTDLISIGMVAETVQDFYAEVFYPDDHCSAFVREAVIPHLNVSPDVLVARPNLKQLILDWLLVLRPSGDGCIHVCYDYDADWALLEDALELEIPDWLVGINIGSQCNKPARLEFFKKTGLPQHHALHDARALLYSYIRKAE